MEYKFTFEDGSEAIAHYGAKGMKWGVWNKETKARYSGGDSSLKGAKKTVKTLNKLDKRKAIEFGRYDNARTKTNRYSSKFSSALKKGKVDSEGVNRKASKYAEKYAESKNAMTQHKNAIKGIEAHQVKLSKQLVSQGYSVQTTSISRSTLTTGEKVLRGALFGAAMVSPAPVAVYYDSRTKGTLYYGLKNKQNTPKATKKPKN